jgi:tRNA threonylcarbamoyl adenosine modification protein YeaZ
MSGWILALDASTSQPVLALGRIDADGPALHGGDALPAAPNQASAALGARIEALLATVGVRPAELGGVAVGRGPGTFTGSRVAVATAMGLALGLDVPAHPVSTLAVVAGGAEQDGPVIALLDARRGEVYAGAFVREGARLHATGEELCASLDAVLAELHPPFPALLGAGLDAHRERVPAALLPSARFGVPPTPAGLWRATVEAVVHGPALDPGHLRVTYLRASYAELGVHAPKRPIRRSPFV